MTQSRRLRYITALALSLSLLFLSLAAGTGARQEQRRGREGAQPPRSTVGAVPPQSSAAAQTGAPFTRPRLVLLIVVDQLRYDYLERFNDLFGAGGFRRLVQEGAFWTQVNYDHTPTHTAPGHATMMTGAWPAETGIIANYWPDLEKGRNISSVEDEQAKLLNAPEERASSPRRLMASTVGDELRLATNSRSKVIGVSMKDRSSILPAGRSASAAYWFSTTSGQFVTSNYYFNQMPQWVTDFNAQRPADKYFGARWERILPESEYTRRLGVDDPLWENIRDAPGDTNKFPHVITGNATGPGPAFYTALDYSPFTNDMVLSFAQQAITNERLGEDADTDVLTVSFSANDYIGHRFGPYSHEVMDMTLRTDRQVEELLKFVDARVGLRNTVVAFTADHGVGPSPEESAAHGLPGTRITRASVLAAMKNAITARYNPKNQQPDPTADYIQAFWNANVYFNRVALKRDGIPLEEIERVAGDASLTVPGMYRYFTRTQLTRRSISPGDALARRVLHGFYPPRSGDVIIIYEPFHYFEAASLVAHGSPYSYDTHVPLVLMGAGFRPARYLEAATPADIAPTLCALLRLQAPSNSVGRVLMEGIVQQGLVTGAR